MNKPTCHNFLILYNISVSLKFGITNYLPGISMIYEVIPIPDRTRYHKNLILFLLSFSRKSEAERIQIKPLTAIFHLPGCLTSLGLANPGNSSCGEELPVAALGLFSLQSL